MTAPNMAAITASLERSLQNCSLNHHHHQSSSSSSGLGFGRSATSDSPPEIHNSHDASLDLNSQISLPYHWEQCLDLKTGEVYYINWRTGMKAKEDPRISNEFSGELYSEDDDSSYDSDEGSSTESSPSSSSRNPLNQNQNQNQNQNKQKREEREKEQTGVLVVAGCKSCLMYFMVPKQVKDCPKCAGQLLHFDRSDDNGSP